MKKSTLSAEELEQFDYLENWYIAVMEFWEQLYPAPSGFSWLDDHPEVKKNKTYLRGLMEAYNDTLEMVRDLPAPKYIELDKILKAKFGSGLFEADKKYVKKVNTIIEKGKITNETQYYMLREYFERIWDMEEHKERAEKLEDMLYSFDLSFEKKEE